MGNIGQFLSGIFLAILWSNVLAFIPVTRAPFLFNPPIYRKEYIRGRGIFILSEEQLWQKERQRKFLLVAGIYGVCFFVVLSGYIINVLKWGGAGIGPFDILLSTSVVLFAFAIVTYLPVALYMYIRKPWVIREEGVCLSRIFVGYGILMLGFCLIFAYSWMQKQHLFVTAAELFYALGIMAVGGMLLAYLPILSYVLVKKLLGLKMSSRIHPNVIFVIYSVCFLAFSAVYVANWYSNWQHHIAKIVW